MLTKEDLQAIGELILSSEERIRKDIVKKSDLEANNRILGTIFRVDLASTQQEIVAAVKAGFQETTKQIKRVEQKLDKSGEDHEERIARLEEHTNIHKN